MSEQNNNIDAQTNPQEIIDTEMISVDSAADNKEVSQTEAKYQKALKLMNSISCMRVCQSKVDICKQAANQFIKLSGYKDSDQYAQECKLLAKQTVSAIKKKAYKNAIKIKDSAKQANDYITAAEHFRKLGKYKNSEELAAECDRLLTKIEKKTIWSKLIKFGIAVLFIIAIIVLLTTSHAKYYYANLCEMTGSYSTAAKMYQKLGEYKDSPEKLEEATKLIVRNSKVGDTVKIGDDNWYLLDSKENKALLMKTGAIQGKAYQDISGEVTWEKSSIRQWLNSEFINTYFSTTEKEQIVLTDTTTPDNIDYGTVGGNATRDYVFLLSIEEANQYIDQLPKVKHNSWLRSPGNTQSAVAFLSVNGNIMNFGYDSSSSDFSVYPVMWFNFK